MAEIEAWFLVMIQAPARKFHTKMAMFSQKNSNLLSLWTLI